MKRGVVYVRISTQEQADNADQFIEQARTIDAFCTANKIEIQRIFGEVSDEPMQERPGITELLFYLLRYSNKIDYVLVTGYDRISRSPAVITEFTETLSYMKIELICVVKNP